MKRILALLLALVMLLAMTACGKDKEGTPTGESTGATTNTSEGTNDTTEGNQDSTQGTTEGTTGGDTTETPTTTPPTTTTPTTTPPTTQSTSGGVLNSGNSTSMSFQTLVSRYSGRWYLDGYYDVYLDISLEAYADNNQNDTLNIKANNFALPFVTEGDDGYIYPDLHGLSEYFSGLGIIRSQYDYFGITQYTYDHKLSFKEGCIYIDSHKFVPTRGSIARAAGITLNKTSLELYVGDSETLIATVFPEGAINKKVTWYSTNDSVVTVSSDGKVTVIAATPYLIGVSAITEDGQYVATCNVTVKERKESSETVPPTVVPPATDPQPIRVSGVQISKTTLSLKVGDTQQLTATVSPSNADNKNVTWSSSNSSVVQVSSTGKITAKGTGSATITVTTTDGNYTAKCTVTVAAHPATEPPTTEPPATEPVSDVLIISNTQTISNQTIDTDVYITSTGVATFNNVTVNGNIYCYGQLKCSVCTANNVYAYAYGSMMSCGAFDGTHGKISGGISCNKITILDNALDYAFSKWGKK